MTFIDPFNNVHTIAGQGTITKELISEAEKVIFNLIMYSVQLVAVALFLVLAPI